VTNGWGRGPSHWSLEGIGCGTLDVRMEAVLALFLPSANGTTTSTANKVKGGGQQ